MKKNVITFTLVILSMATAYAGLAPSILPESSHYQGRHSFSYFLDDQSTISGHLEFAVYKDNEAQTMKDWTGYTGDGDYVYAYQIFSDESSTAALTYFALTGIDPDTIADVQNDIGEAESLNNVFHSNGVEPTSGEFNDSATKAIWQFADGTLVQNEQSWFLFLYSNKDWIAGGMEIQASNDDIPVPEVPEPATLALLSCGALLTLRRKNKSKC